MQPEADADVVTPEFTVTVSPHQKMPRGLKVEKLLEAANFVLDVLGAYLPEEFPLDGSSEIEIRLGSSGDDPRYDREGDRAIIYQEAFDPADWKKAAAEEKDEKMLEAIAGILDRVAHAFRGDRRAIKDAVKKVVKAKFEAKVPEPDLSLEVPEQARGAELTVFRNITRDGEEWSLEVRSAKGRVIKRDSIAEDVELEEARKRFQESRWDDTEFKILNGKGKVTYSLELEPSVS